MKKSFMTRALATGLSLAMALSLSVADTSIASAAAKKASVTSMMKVSSKSVTEGKKVTTYMNSTAAKKYRIKSHTETATAKKYISVVMTKNRKGLTISAKDGAVTAANLTKKGVNVKINFAPATSVAAVKKAAATKYVNLKVVVNAKPEAKLTMTAEATGVKKIAVTFNKAVDTTTTKIVVKKGSATPTIASTTFASDAKSAELAMGAKLTEGTYTVEVTSGEDVLKADIAVKNEAMTAFKLVSTNLVAKPKDEDKKDATISFKAVNQYGEPMNASNLSVSCSFSSDTTLTTAPTTDKNGVITVKNIVDSLRIDGQTGTIVIVNKDNGVNLNETITYRTKAVAASADVLGLYSTKTEKVVEGNIKVGATVSQYRILVNVKDQYESDMDKAAIVNSGSEVTLNPASVLTDLTIPDNAKAINTTNAANFDDITYDGKSCIAIPLSADASTVAKAGTLTLTMVGASKGVLATPSFTVDDVVVIQSVNVSAADTIYDESEAKLIVDAVDVNGNAVTKYDDLKAAFKDTFTKDPQITLKKNADGTGTFYYKPVGVFTTNTSKQNTSLPVPKMFYANDAASGKYIVKPVNFTVFEEKTPVSISGLASDAITAVANVTGAALTFDLGKVTLEDQYANTIKYSALNAGQKTSVKAYLKDDKHIFGESGNVTFTDGKVDFTAASTTKGSATLYLKYNTSLAGGNNDPVSDEKYDYKVTLSAVDVSDVTASDLTLKVNDGNSIYGADKVRVEKSVKTKKVGSATTGAIVTCSAIVTAKVGGKNVVIPTDMYTITAGEYLGEYMAVNDGKNGGTKIDEKTEEKTVTIVFGNSGNEVVSTKVTVSNANRKAVEIKKADSNKVTNVGAALATAIKIVDQYGNDITDKSREIIYNVTFTGKDADLNQKKLVKNNTQSVRLKDGETIASGSTASVTYTYGGLTFTTDVEFGV